jgi:hypothetical protein
MRIDLNRTTFKTTSTQQAKDTQQTALSIMTFGKALQYLALVLLC